MFSVKEKQHLAKAVEDAIRELKHPEMDNENIKFLLHVDGKEEWSWADIHQNSKPPGDTSLWNEIARDFIK